MLSYCIQKNFKDSEWIKGLNVKPEAIKFLGKQTNRQKNIGKCLYNLELSKIFLEIILKQVTKL